MTGDDSYAPDEAEAGRVPSGTLEPTINGRIDLPGVGDSFSF